MKNSQASRREALRRAGRLGALVGLAPLAQAAGVRAAARGDYGPFKMGIQSYSLRNYTTTEALAKTKALGLGHWESFPAHVPTDMATVAASRKQAEAAGVSVSGYGVVHFGKDTAANRAIFEFAKALGVGYLSADPDPESFASLDELVDEFRIPVGIHNHGPGHRYDTIASIEKAIAGHSKGIGCCVDTGHFLRSGVDPVDAAKAFRGRVYGVHLKDVKGKDTFTVLGAGDLRLVDLLAELGSQDYGLCLALEYEEKPENPIADIESCLKATRSAIAKAGLA